MRVVALIVSFMLGLAAGDAVPVPCGVGSTEGVLVAALVAGGVRQHARWASVLPSCADVWLRPVMGLLAVRALVRLEAL